MKFQTLINGDQMPAIGLGTWKHSPEEVGGVVTTAIENGYRHIDCAKIYLNEAEIGEAFTSIFQRGSVSRGDLWITSKLWNNSHRAEHVRPALEKTLKDLKLDSLDLYLMHWPVAVKPDVVVAEKGDDFLSLDDVPLLETWNAMEACVAAGLCRNIGVSNFNQPKIQGLIDHSNTVPAVNQVESHPLLQQSSLLNYCNQKKVCFTAYSPLGSGDRPDKMRKENEPRMFEIPEIISIAEQHGMTPGRILLAWAVQRGTIAIPKSTSLEHLQDNLASADVELSQDEMNIITNLDRDYRYVDGAFWEIEGSGYTVQSLWNE